MKRDLLRTVLVFMLLGCGIFWSFAADEANRTMKFGYCDEQAELLLERSAGRSVYYAYIAIPKDYVTLLQGSKITKVTFAVGSCRKAPNTNFKINITKDYYTNNVFEYQQDGTIEVGTSTDAKWNTVELETPYVIEGDEEIYVGYQVEASNGHYPVAYAPDYVAKTGRSDVYGYVTTDGSAGCWSTGKTNAIILTIEGATVPAADVDLMSVKTDRYGYQGYNTTLRCQVRNNGAKTVEGYDYTYTLKYGGTEYPQVSGSREVALKSGDFDFLEFDIPITEEMSGTVTVQMNVSLKAEDANPDNNSYKCSFTVPENAVPRKVLMEMFVADYDPASINGYQAAANACDLVGVENVSTVRYYLNSGDLSTDIYDEYAFFYKPEEVMLPGVMVDRSMIDEEYYLPVIYPYEELKSWTKYMYENPAIIRINASNATIDADTEEITFDVEVEAVDEPDASRDLRLNVFIVEDNVAGVQKGAPNYNDFVHHGVFRTAVTGAWGEAISLDTPLSKTYQFHLPKFSKSENLRAVVFVSYYDPNDNLACEVLNSFDMPMGLPHVENSGVADAAIESNATVVTLAGKIVVTGIEQEVAIYNIDGTRVASSCDREFTANTGSGLFIVVADGVAQKVIVK